MVAPDLWRKEFFRSSLCSQSEMLSELGQPVLNLESNQKPPRQETRAFEKILASSLVYIAEIPSFFLEVHSKK